MRDGQVRHEKGWAWNVLGIDITFEAYAKSALIRLDYRSGGTPHVHILSLALIHTQLSREFQDKADVIIVNERTSQKFRSQKSTFTLYI